jgi:hypothetical protein
LLGNDFLKSVFLWLKREKAFQTRYQTWSWFSNLFVSELKAAQSAAGLNFQLVESCSRMLLQMARILDRIQLLRLEDRP